VEDELAILEMNGRQLAENLLTLGNSGVHHCQPAMRKVNVAILKVFIFSQPFNLTLLLYIFTIRQVSFASTPLYASNFP